MTSDQVCLIAMGGNLPSEAGMPAETISAALRHLEARGAVLEGCSAPYRCPAFPPGSGPDFVNAAALLRVAGPPEAVLARLHEVEATFGRRRAQRWGPRTLDLDLIALGDLVLPDREVQAEWRALDAAAQQSRAPERLILPHPRMQERAFVLAPLAEVAPDWRHPLTGLSVSEMLAALPEAARAEVEIIR